MKVWTVGRAPECDIVLGHPNVSRIHARIEKRPQGLRIWDADSSRGTKVNGHHVGANGHRLERGDVVAFGGHEVPTRHGPLAVLFRSVPDRPAENPHASGTIRDSRGRPLRLPVGNAGPGRRGPDAARANQLPSGRVVALALGLGAIALAAAAAVWAGGMGQAPGITSDPRASVLMLVAQSGPAQYQGVGTGFVSDHKQAILTNAHVAMVLRACADHPDCTPKAVAHNRPNEPFEITDMTLHRLADDPFEGPFAANKGAILVADVALLEVAAPGELPAGLPLAALDEVGEGLVGQPVEVAGFPGETMHPSMPVATRSQGIVGRVWPPGTADFIQHEANITPGSSGSPLLNAQGKVIGINYAGASIEAVTVFDSLSGKLTLKRLNAASGLNLAAGVRFIHDLL